MSPFQALHGWSLQKPSFVPIETQPRAFDPKNWASDLVLRMTRAIGTLHQKTLESKTEKIDSTPLKPGTKCLIYTEMPPGKSSKLFTHWRGIYIIKKQLDVDTYVVTLVGDGRKEYIVYRPRIRPFYSENANNGPENGLENTSENPQEQEKVEGLPSPELLLEQTPGPRRSSRVAKPVDYKKYF
jgi:hypothetical protein